MGESLLSLHCCPQVNDPAQDPAFLLPVFPCPHHLLLATLYITRLQSWLTPSFPNTEVILLIAASAFKSLLIFNYQCRKLACHRMTFCSEERNEMSQPEKQGNNQKPIFMQISLVTKKTKETEQRASLLCFHGLTLAFANVQIQFWRELNKIASLYKSSGSYKHIRNSNPLFLLMIHFGYLIGRMSLKQSFCFEKQSCLREANFPAEPPGTITFLGRICEAIVLGGGSFLYEVSVDATDRHIACIS